MAMVQLHGEDAGFISTLMMDLLGGVTCCILAFVYISVYISM
jgi:hypothetical protein